MDGAKGDKGDRGLHGPRGSQVGGAALREVSQGQILLNRWGVPFASCSFFRAMQESEVQRGTRGRKEKR